MDLTMKTLNAVESENSVEFPGNLEIESGLDEPVDLSKNPKFETQLIDFPNEPIYDHLEFGSLPAIRADAIMGQQVRTPPGAAIFDTHQRLRGTENLPSEADWMGFLAANNPEMMRYTNTGENFDTLQQEKMFHQSQLNSYYSAVTASQKTTSELG